jgi:DeoR family transcriptional regulator, glycerol-3-phosphate regulon repressor
VFTNSPLVARALWQAARPCEVYLLGGRYSGEAAATLGPITLEQIASLRADHAVLTIGAIDQSGRFMDFDADEAYVARAMIARARKTTILADSTKLGTTALFEVCAGAQVARMVTDAPPPHGLQDALAAEEVEVVVAADSLADA